MKYLKFTDELVRRVLNGEKFTTWRINEEKGLEEGDVVPILNDRREEVAKAKITKIKKTTFSKLTEDDKKGHEEFNSESEMYAIYSQYYHMKVNPETKLDVIKFELVK